MHTSAIEGEVLDRASVQASFLRRLGLSETTKRHGPAEEGIAAMMVDLCRSVSEPLSEDMLCEWHLMLMRANRQLVTVGNYRRYGDPMQIVSGANYGGRATVHYEAPPSDNLLRQMSRFINWFNRATEEEGRERALCIAATTHLWFECIHPFEDGNGRIGRALIEKALARTLRRLTVVPVSSQISVERKAYYRCLNQASRIQSADVPLNTKDWFSWFADMTLRAQQRGTRIIEAVFTKAKVLRQFGAYLNERQVKALERLFQAEPDGFEGGMSSGNYQSITGAPTSTATRDLAGMVEMGILKRTGERRHTRYAIDWSKLREDSASNV